MRRPPPSPRRPGFTLVEILVVIVIIGVLVALLLPAIGGAMRTAKNTTVTGEITTLSQALAAFKEKYGDYPPSRIMLSENGQYNMAATFAGDEIDSGNGTGGADITYGVLMQRSVSYLRKFWPRVALTTGTTPVWGPTSTTWYDFDGDGIFDTTPYILEGDEALCFFLGGVPLNTGTATEPSWSMSGWGRVPTNPFSNNLTGNTMYNGNRTPPLYEFNGGRLRDRDEPTKDATRFPSYHDSLGTDAPFAYFSAYGGEAYDPNDVNFAPLNAAGLPAGAETDDLGTTPILRGFRVAFPVASSGGTVSRVAISAAPNPYHTSPTLKPGVATPKSEADYQTTQWHKGSSFQIISPGADGLYGIGGVYAPSSTNKLPADMGTVAGTTEATIRTRENDNLSSFAAGPLD